MAQSPAHTNRLLSALPREDFNRLAARMDDVTLGPADVVYRAGQVVRHVYFPTSGILSAVVDMEDGGTVEAGTIGFEGMAGMAAYLGCDRSPGRVYCELPPCTCLRLPADVFRNEVLSGGALRDVVFRYTAYLMAQMSQSIACNRLHQVEARLARWLLMTHDRVGADEFPLTQQALSEMLGVTRPSVTVAAGILQQAGLIRYIRGRIEILDRERLEEATCECYRVVRGHFDRLIP